MTATITTVLAPPNPDHTSGFDADAYQFTQDLVTWTEQANALATEVSGEATTITATAAAAAASAAAAAGSASAAAASASTATTKAADSSAAAAAAAGSAAAASAAVAYIYPGVYTSDPATRPDGSARQAGDYYFNSSSNLSKRFNGATWAASDINTANLAASTGTSLLGWIRDIAGAVATTLKIWIGWQPVTPFDFMSAAMIADVQSGNPVMSHQAALDTMMGSAALTIRFPPGIYRGILANGVSNRTFIFDEGAVIDGVAHIATGTGPDVGGGAVTLVKNVRVIGTITSSCRVGCYYTKGLNIDKIRITEINSIYTGQTADGGSRGVHIYHGSQDVTIGEILCDSATLGTYALGMDIGATNDADHWVTRVKIGKLSVKNCTQGVLATAFTKDCSIGEIYCDGARDFGGIVNTSDDNLRVGTVRLIGTGAIAGRPGIYIISPIRVTYGDVDVSAWTSHGFRTVGGSAGAVKVGKVKSTGNTLDGVNIQSAGTVIDFVQADSNTGTGLNVTTSANGSIFGKVSANANVACNVNVEVPDISIDEIKSTNCAAFYGVNLSNATRFRNRSIEASGNTQGLRMSPSADASLGHLYLHDNASGFIGSAVTGLSYLSLRYGGNTVQDTNFGLERSPGFRGRLSRACISTNRGDNSITIAVDTDSETQYFDTALTANRTVTLSNSGATVGDKFRITRTPNATGAFTLDVGGGMKVLAVGQWCEVHYRGGAWILTAAGSL